MLAPWIDGSLSMPEVLSVERRRVRGLYAPLLDCGTLLVDGTAASCYAIPRNLADTSAYRRAAKVTRGGVHAVCHASFLPLRALCRAAAHAGGAAPGKKAIHPGGIHPYAW